MYPATAETTPDAPLPVIIYLHRGGWGGGSLETHGRAMHALANASGCLVAAVDYALAPENPFPSAITEVAAVVEHLQGAGADAWGADPARIALAGDSAGANIAIGTALHRRDRGDRHRRGRDARYLPAAPPHAPRQCACCAAPLPI